MSPFQDAYIERINKGEETYSAEGLAAIVREIFIIGAESESVLMRWKCETFYEFYLEVKLFRMVVHKPVTLTNQHQVTINYSQKGLRFI